MSFRFNFSKTTEDNVQEYNKHTNTNNAELGTCSVNAPSVACQYLDLCTVDSKVVLDNNVQTFECAGFMIKYVQQNAVDTKVNLKVIEENKSDLLPGKYEGGLKVWECSLDLSLFLAENKCIKENDTVLELGCGVGLPGIVAYLHGGAVTFQDFNLEVLELVTLPNVRLNTIKELQSSISEKCQFLSGDWKCIKENFYDAKENRKVYDLIITSETIYEKSNMRKLLDLMQSALKPEGTIYLASKVHYFGVGGGIHDFEQLLKKDNIFEFSTVFRTGEGVERQILKLNFKDMKRFM